MVTPPAPKRIAIAIELDHNLAWYQDIFEGIFHYGTQRGWSCHIDPFLVGPAGQENLSDYDGVVGRLDDELAQMATDIGLPAINLLYTNSCPQMHTLAGDSYGCSRIIAEHLINCGYRRFGLIMDREDYATSSFYLGMAKEITDRGFEEPAVISLQDPIESGREQHKAIRVALAKWVRKLTKPVGVMVRSATEARYLALTCIELGIRIPEQLGIAAYEDAVSACNGSPTITALEFDYFDKGIQAAMLLEKLMNNEKVQPIHRTISPQRIVIRESTDVFLSEDELISDVMRYIAEHAREHLTIDQIASHLEVSSRTLRRRFEQVLGRTVHCEIRRLRVEYIKQLLIETQLPISSIVDQCGFSSTSHLARYFKKETGQTPKAFRKTHGS